MEIEEFEEQEEVEEEFEEKSLTSSSAINLIEGLHGPHIDNAVYQYYAKDIRVNKYSSSHSMMPHTSFVYEFFIFNSLYQIDWKSSFKKLVYHSREDCGESKMQRDFISFLKQNSQKTPQYIYRSFVPLLYFETQGEWTSVVPDERVSKEQGYDFFKNINLLKSIINKCKTPSEIPTSKKVFDLLQKCTFFIYLVRNNIFHGAKRLGDIYDTNQQKRIEIYNIFIKCINSLFFLLAGKDKAACDYIHCPIYTQSSYNNSTIIMDRYLILKAMIKDMMKTADSQLIMQFLKYTHNKIDIYDNISEQAALYYPSAGTDFITPILIGLPFCRHFYFFDHSV